MNSKCEGPEVRVSLGVSCNGKATRVAGAERVKTTERNENRRVTRQTTLNIEAMVRT